MAKSLLFERLYDLLNLVRPFTGLGGEVHARLGYLHLLSPHADERKMRADKDFAGTKTGKGNFASLQGATSQKLPDLLHDWLGRCLMGEGVTEATWDVIVE